MKITNGLLNQIIQAEEIGRQDVISPEDFDSIVRKAHEIDPWEGAQDVLLWSIEEHGAEVFLMTVDLPSGLRMASVSFEPKDVFGMFPSEDTDGECKGTGGIRKLLTFVDTHIGLAFEELARHTHNT